MINEKTILLDAALTYAKLGFAVFPVHSKRENGSCTCNNDECKSVGKHPRTTNGLKNATKDPSMIRFWWNNAFKDSNVAIATGRISGFFAVDVDVKHDGLKAWETFKDDYNFDDYETPVQQTPSGGKHVLYNMPVEGKVLTRTNVLAQGIDIRGDGGYIVAAPSEGYSYESDQGIGEIQLQEAPESILKEVVKVITVAKNDTPATIPTAGLYELGKDETNKIKDALQHVDPDDHSMWWSIGAALHSTNGLDAFKWWCEWAQQSDKFDHNEHTTKWADFDARRGNTETAIYIEYLYSEAEKNGWVETFDHSDCFFDPNITNEEFQMMRVNTEKQKLELKLPASFIDQQPSELVPQLLPVKAFNYAMLPESIRDYVKDVAYRMDNTSPDYVAVAFMALVAGLVGARVAVQPKAIDIGWTEVPTLWAAVVGRPSAKKTPALSEALSLLKPIQKDFDKQHKEELTKYSCEKKLYSIKEKGAEKRAKTKASEESIDDDELREILLSTPSFDLIAPSKRDTVINDATVEALAIRLDTNPYGVLLCRDELTGWLAQMSREDRAHERSFYLEGFSAKNTPYSQERVIRDNIKLDRIVVSILGGIQPAKLIPLLLSRKSGGGDDGLLERFQLAVYPDNSNMARVDKEPDDYAKHLAQQVIEDIANIPDPENGNAKVYNFSPEAQALYNQKYDEIIEELKLSDDSWQTVLGKHTTLLAKIALLIHLMTDSHLSSISISALDKATLWLEYLQSHAKRIYGLVEDSTAGAYVLLSKLAILPNPFTMSDFKTKGWSKLTSSEQRALALSALVDNGYLFSEKVQEGKGRPVVKYYKHPSLIN